MKINVLLCLISAICVTTCNQNPSVANKTRNGKLPKDPAISAPSSDQTRAAVPQECKPGTSLLFEDAGISCFTEDTIRGPGVVSFQFETNNRMDIFNLDGTSFGNFVLNEDGDFYTLDMPQKTTARQVIPNLDFAAFDFDAEPVNANQDSLLIYVNKEKRKVEKNQLKYTYNTWPQYLLNNTINLKPCNLLKSTDGKIISKSLDQIFRITAVKGDLIEIKSIKGCQADIPYQDMRGTVKWREAGRLLIDFASCD